MGKTLEQGLQSVRERDVTSRKSPGQEAHRKEEPEDLLLQG